ncbi:ROK family protein [Inhella gelatinilytica]|uniref:ROK family protein n=1 Tax=Inhella gelatinilytica TaxID=2795030 RepID=A0A931IZF1_9BURK|nr:ROK family protein [Inhella gelatinilytica]MBH9552616.1 ROK family protein [Inhella gelatinilytica]
MSTPPTCVLAADLGGTSTRAALVDSTGQLLRLAQGTTPAQQGAAAVLATLKTLLIEARGDAQPQALGLSLAGVIDPSAARVLDATDALPGWKGTALYPALAELGLPLAARNDVHAALLGERWLGGLRECDHGALMTLGTGLGAGLLINGRLHTGRGHLAGHLGRTEVLHEGQRLPLEALLSGTGLARLHGSAANGHEVLARVQQGDTRAQSALQTWVGHLALALHNLHWLLDPGRVLIGGGLIEARTAWWPLLQPLLDALPLEVKPAELGARAGLLGAAHLAFTEAA